MNSDSNIHLPELSMSIDSLRRHLRNTYNIELIETMNEETAPDPEKMQILAKYFAKSRIEGDPHLDKVLDLQDYWDDIYEENRIKMSFGDAQILANESVIAHVLNNNYAIKDDVPTKYEHGGLANGLNSDDIDVMEVVEHKFLPGEWVKQNFGADVDYELDNDEINDTDSSRNRITRNVLLVEIKDIPQDKFDAFFENFEKNYIEAANELKTLGLELNDILSINEERQATFVIIDDEDEFENGGVADQSNYYVIAWKTQDDYENAREEETPVDDFDTAQQMANDKVTNQKYFASQVNDRLGEIVWSSIEELEQYNDGGILGNIVLDAPVIPQENDTFKYRWVVDVASPGVNSVMRVEKYSPRLEEWIGTPGQWHMGTLLNKPGFYGGKPSDTIYLDMGSGWAVSGLLNAIKEAEAKIGPDQFAHGGYTGQWFKEAVEAKAPYHLDGWSKNKPAASRRRSALKSRTSSLNHRAKHVSAGRALQALANVTQDARTKQLAQTDARYFFKKAKQLNDGAFISKDSKTSQPINHTQWELAVAFEIRRKTGLTFAQSRKLMKDDAAWVHNAWATDMNPQSASDLIIDWGKSQPPRLSEVPDKTSKIPAGVDMEHIVDHLVNDENTFDEDMINFLVAEYGLSKSSAKALEDHRSEFLGSIASTDVKIWRAAEIIEESPEE